MHEVTFFYHFLDILDFVLVIIIPPSRIMNGIRGFHGHHLEVGAFDAFQSGLKKHFGAQDAVNERLPPRQGHDFMLAIIFDGSGLRDRADDPEVRVRVETRGLLLHVRLHERVPPTEFEDSAVDGALIFEDGEVWPGQSLQREDIRVEVRASEFVQQSRPQNVAYLGEVLPAAGVIMKLTRTPQLLRGHSFQKDIRVHFVKAQIGNLQFTYTVVKCLDLRYRKFL